MLAKISGTLAAAVAALAWSGAALAEVTVNILYLRHEVMRPPVLSNLDPVPETLGIDGAQLAVAEVATTGNFLGHSYALTVLSVPPEGDFTAAARQALGQAQLLLLDAPAQDMLAVADLPEAAKALLFNISSGEGRLRDGDCRPNLFHTALETAARSDALMQVLQAKQWRRLAMIVGPKPADQAYAQALRHSAAKFGLEILGEKDWTFDTDLRESTMDEIPRFTQDLPDHDVLLVADETDDFGRYVEHNTWLPRPVAGSDGMVPTDWSPVIEAWGAAQLQDRFTRQTGRGMAAQDYAAWIAVRALGDAVTRTGSADPATLRARLLDPALALDGFKGWSLSFRDWNGQLRQPVAVVNARALVTLAPLPGFLHQVNEMDTLGLDRPESTCTAFGGTP